METNVAKKEPSTRNRAFSFLAFIAAVLLAWLATRPWLGGAAALAGSVRCDGPGSSVEQVAGSDVDSGTGLGDGEQQRQLRLMFYKGRGVAQSDVEAARRFRKAADQRLAEAQGNLGNHVCQGPRRGAKRRGGGAVVW